MGSDSVVQATVRLTIIGEDDRVDLAVPLWSDLAAVAASQGERTGTTPTAFLTAAGRELAMDRPVHALRLTHGDLLVAVSEPAAVVGGAHRGEPAPQDQPSEPQEPAVAPSGPFARAAPVTALVAALVAGATGAVAGGVAAEATVLGLLLVAVVVAVLAHGTRAAHADWLAVAPTFAAAAAFLSTQPARPEDTLAGALLLGAVAAGLALAATAAALRAAWPDVAEEALLVQVVGGLVLAVIGAVCLVLDWPATTFWSLVLAAAVIGIRLLPRLVVDVPDHVLLDFARLAATAWSAREQPRRSFRGTVREDDVRRVAERALRMVGAGSILCSAAAVTAGAALVLADTSGSRHVGALLVSGAAGAALALGGRSLRASGARRWQRAAGTVLMGAVAVAVLLDLPTDWRTAAAAACVLLGLLLAFVARAAGRGWTSVWWSRRAEVAEGLAGVAVLGALPLAAGLVAWMRLLTSP